MTPYGSPDDDVAIIQVASIHLHPGFYREPKGQGSVNDIALLKLSRSLEFTMRRQKIRIPDYFPGWGHPGLTLDIAGWGQLAHNKLVSEDLRMYQAKDLPFRACFFNLAKNVTGICYEGPTNVGPCLGDSGAAVATRWNAQWVQVGVHIIGRPNCDYSLWSHAIGMDASQNCGFIEDTIGEPMCISLGKK
ncbi:unnamed protein product, partial [Mesorhabditis spiculigera]